MVGIYFLSFVALGALRLVAAWSEVIPGPGLPSLESLGVTSEQLYNTLSTPVTVSRVEKRAVDFDSVCLDQGKNGAAGEDVMACYNYLSLLKTTTCQVPGGNGSKQVFCTAATGTVVGQNIGSAPGGTSSRCDYVAFAVGWSFVSCTKNVPAQNNNLFASGSCAAYGNGSLRVDTVLVGTSS